METKVVKDNNKVQSLIKMHNLKITNERVINIRSTLQEIVDRKNGILTQEDYIEDETMTTPLKSNNKMTSLKPIEIITSRQINSPTLKTIDFSINFQNLTSESQSRRTLNQHIFYRTRNETLPILKSSSFINELSLDNIKKKRVLSPLRPKII